jgi:hypothetical protein
MQLEGSSQAEFCGFWQVYAEEPHNTLTVDTVTKQSASALNTSENLRSATLSSHLSHC